VVLRVSRREFLVLAFGYSATVGLLSLGEALPNRSLLRPPGALPEKQFSQRCIRCGMCVDVCPVRTLRPADLSDGLRCVGTPKLAGYCIVFRGLENPSAKGTKTWKDTTRRRGQEKVCFECIKACPSGALGPVDVGKLRMGIAVVDRELCKAWRYHNCTFDCVDACPFDAIAVGVGPEVREADCVGCNQCNYACVVRPSAISVVPIE
jgi:ferredoxin-type protein NapG